MASASPLSVIVDVSRRAAVDFRGAPICHAFLRRRRALMLPVLHFADDFRAGDDASVLATGMLFMSRAADALAAAAGGRADI